TDACLGRLDPAELSKVDLDGQWVSGAKPSKTLALHQGIYRADPAAQGVVHTHAAHLHHLVRRDRRQHFVLAPHTGQRHRHQVGR
ncbi:hypothetical protein FGX01_03270, partial [Xylella fastidiosa subsp. multiplex]|nr:hypothetical protein [Xylella fastidiosa subsp. multiplex]